MRQGCRSPLSPVLHGRVCIDHFGQLLGLVADKNAVTLSGGIALLEIGVRKTCRGERRITGRCKPLVERAKTGASDVWPDNVEHAAIVFVGVEAVVQELAQEASALRGAE